MAEVFGCLPPSATWFESGRVFLAGLRSAAAAAPAASAAGDEHSVAVRVRLSPRAPSPAPPSLRCACWVFSPASGLFERVARSAVDPSGGFVRAFVPRSGPVWSDDSALLEWVAWAPPEADPEVSRVAGMIETRPPVLSEELRDAVTAFIRGAPRRADECDRHGQTLLHAACTAGNTELAEWLVRKCGASVDAEDVQHWTPLFCALSNGHMALAKTLIMLHKASVAQRASNGSTALHLMCGSAGSRADKAQWDEIVSLLLSFGVPVDCQRIDGVTPLMQCVQRRNLHGADVLLVRSADVNHVSGTGDTAIHLAVESHCAELAKLLVMFGADCRARGSLGKSAIELAAAGGNREMIEAVNAFVGFQQLDSWIVAYILHFLPPEDVSSCRRVCKLLNRVGSEIFTRQEYWDCTANGKEAFLASRRFKLRFGNNMAEWQTRNIEGHEIFMKIAILGEQYIGKKELAHSMVHDTVIGTRGPLRQNDIGDFDIFTRIVRGTKCKIQLNVYPDTCYTFRSLNTSFYRGVRCFIIAYDITSRPSWDNALCWVKETERYGMEGCAILFVGTKADLESKRAVSAQEVLDKCAESNYQHVLVSSMTGQNVQLCAKAAAELALEVKRAADEAAKAQQQARVVRPKPQPHNNQDCSVM